MTRVFLRAPDVPPQLAKQVLANAGVRHVAKNLTREPDCLRALDNHTTVYIVFLDTDRGSRWLHQVHDFLRQSSATVYWFHPDAVMWSTRPYEPGN